MTSDAEIHAQIEQLVADEHELEERSAAQAGLSELEHARLERIKLHLDQSWDLLRQRRAKAEAGFDPNEARERDVAVVESYEQ